MRYGLWRLATVSRFSAGSFSPLEAHYQRCLRAPFPNVLFVRRFSRTHFHACLASHSQRVPVDEKEEASYDGGDAMKVVCVGIAVLAFAGIVVSGYAGGAEPEGLERISAGA